MSSELNKIFIVGFQISFILNVDFTTFKTENKRFVLLNVGDFKRKRNNKIHMFNEKFKNLSGDIFNVGVVGKIVENLELLCNSDIFETVFDFN